MEGHGQVGRPGPETRLCRCAPAGSHPGTAPARRWGCRSPLSPLLSVLQDAYEERMRRSLDPEGFEDPGIKGSHLSLGEMSSE